MTRVEEILAELREDINADKAERASAPVPAGEVVSPMLMDVALEAAASCAVLRLRLARLTAAVERLGGAP